MSMQNLRYPFMLATALIFSAALLFAASKDGSAAAPSIGHTPPGWVAQSIQGLVSFAYPESFTPAGDAGPGYMLVGGALQNKAHTAYDLLLGVAVNSTSGATVQTVEQQLRTMYANDRLLMSGPTPYGTELSFAMPGGITYDVYVAPVGNAVREIIVNNEHSDSSYNPLIETFLSTVQNVPQNSTQNA